MQYFLPFGSYRFLIIIFYFLPFAFPRFFCVVLATGNLFTLFSLITNLAAHSLVVELRADFSLFTRLYIQGNSLQQGSHPPSYENTLNNFKYSAFNLFESAVEWAQRFCLHFCGRKMKNTFICFFFMLPLQFSPGNSPRCSTT